MANPKAQAAKEKGNQSFKAGDYPAAIGHYTSAILADKNPDPTFYLNRAAAYLKLGKYEDAERDCTTVLGLSKNNVKGLFRRGQASVGLGKLLEAEKDFSQILRIEPSNTAAQDELKSVMALIQNEKAKKSKSPISPVQSSLAPETTAGKRRRVPIKIIDASGQPVSTSVPTPSASASTPAASSATAKKTPEPEPKPKPKAVKTDTKPPAPAPAIKPQAVPRPAQAPSAAAAVPKSATKTPDTLEAVSSRSLKPSPPVKPSPPAKPSSQTQTPPQARPPANPFPPQPQPSPSTQPHPAPPTQSPNGRPTAPSPASPTSAPAATVPPPPAPASFKEAKESRTARVGGGIFRKNGEKTIFASRGGVIGSAAASGLGAAGANVNGAGPASTSVPAQTQAQPKKYVFLTRTENTVNGGKPPTTLFEFTRLWEGLKGPEARWGLINTIPPAQFPALCKTSLEPSLLVSILEVFLIALNSLPPSTSPSPSISPSSLPSSVLSQAQGQEQADADQLKHTIKEYLTHFALIPRFSTLLLFLSKQEKRIAREVWALLGVGADAGVNGKGLEGVWKAVVA